MVDYTQDPELMGDLLDELNEVFGKEYGDPNGPELCCEGCGSYGACLCKELCKERF